MRRVLVTGSGGFVGRYLTDKLVAEGYAVWGVDRAQAPEGFGGKDHLVCDLGDLSEVGSVFDAVRPDWVVHLAAQSSAGKSFSAPHSTIRNNVLPVLHILDRLRTENTETRLLAVGSADVYGPVDAATLPLREALPAHPNNPYALSKTIQEFSCELYASLYGVDVVSTRSFNHTGAGRPETFVLSSFARQIIEIRRGSCPARVDVGNLEVRRDFLDVRDVCRAYTLLLQKGRAGEIYNVCSGRSYNLRALLERLAELAGVDVEIRVDPTRVRPADMEELRGDHSKLTAETGWQPEVPMDDTLQSLLDYWSRAIE